MESKQAQVSELIQGEKVKVLRTEGEEPEEGWLYGGRFKDKEGVWRVNVVSQNSEEGLTNKYPKEKDFLSWNASED